MAVYFIQKQDGTGPIKIGYAADPIGRLQTIDAMNPEPLKLLGTIDGGIPLEHALHRQYAEFRVRGEWFSPSQNILDMISGALISGSIDIRTEAQRTSVMKRMYSQGSTLQEIGDKFSITRERVRQILNSIGVGGEGLRDRHRRKTPASKSPDQVIEFNKQGLDDHEIADKISDTVQNVRKALRMSGIDITRKKRATSSDVLEKANLIADSYARGEGTRAIAERHGMTQPDIYRYLRVANVTPSRRYKETNA